MKGHLHGRGAVRCVDGLGQEVESGEHGRREVRLARDLEVGRKAQPGQGRGGQEALVGRGIYRFHHKDLPGAGVGEPGKLDGAGVSPIEDRPALRGHALAPQRLGHCVAIRESGPHRGQPRHVIGHVERDKHRRGAVGGVNGDRREGETHKDRGRRICLGKRRKGQDQDKERQDPCHDRDSGAPGPAHP